MTEAPSTPTARHRWAWLLLLPVALITVFALAGPIVSGDLWWHLETGEWILDQGELPEHDPFSHTAQDKSWTLEEYGSQVLFASLYRLGGLGSLRVFGGLLGLLVLVAAFRVARHSLPPFWAAAATALFALLFALKWELRPHLLSVFFLFRLQHLLFPAERERDPATRQWIEVFLLTVLWVQLHAEAIFVPILAIAGLIGAILGATRDREGGIARVRSWALVLVLAIAGSLCSPEGWNQIRYALSDSSVPRTYIEEWAPAWIFPDDPRFAPVSLGLFRALYFSIVLSAFFVLSSAVARLTGRRAIISWERIGFLAVCVLLAILARRFFWLLFFPMLDVTALLLCAKPVWKARRIVPALVALLLAVPLANSHYVKFARQSWDAGAWNQSFNANLFPLHAATFIDEAKLEGNLFHRYEWGGFLGFHLWPECPVYLDGRTVLFSEVIPERWQVEHWRGWSYPEGSGSPGLAQEVLDRRDVRLIVMPSLMDLLAGVSPWKPPDAHANWIRIWADATAMVWMRWNDEENLNRVKTWYAKYGIEFDPKIGFVDAQVLSSKPEWIHERGMLSPTVREFVEPMLFGTEDGAVTSWSPTARLELWLRVGMGRSARWELKQFLAQKFSHDEVELAAWNDSLKTDSPGVVYGRLKRGERP